MTELEQIQQDIASLKNRNKKVEADKVWETSWFRKVLIAVLTYIVIVIFFVTAEFQRPMTSAIVPTLGFILSTITVPIIKKIWLDRRNK